jgi:hypothetical protein
LPTFSQAAFNTIFTKVPLGVSLGEKYWLGKNKKNQGIKVSLDMFLLLIQAREFCDKNVKTSIFGLKTVVS